MFNDTLILQVARLEKYVHTRSQSGLMRKSIGVSAIALIALAASRKLPVKEMSLSTRCSPERLPLIYPSCYILNAHPAMCSFLSKCKVFISSCMCST